METQKIIRRVVREIQLHIDETDAEGYTNTKIIYIDVNEYMKEVLIQTDLTTSIKAI